MLFSSPEDRPSTHCGCNITSNTPTIYLTTLRNAAGGSPAACADVRGPGHARTAVAAAAAAEAAPGGRWAEVAVAAEVAAVAPRRLSLQMPGPRLLQIRG